MRTWATVFRERVAAHYRQRGYTVHENVRLRGKSGAIHACDMVLQGDLGNLVVGFEDAGGFEGPEIGAFHRMAHDVGAAAILAVEAVPPGVRPFADKLGVVLLTPDALAAAPEPASPSEPEPFEEHPWPTQVKPDWPGPPRSDSEPGDIDSLVDAWSGPPPDAKVKPVLWKHARDDEIEAPVPAPPAEPEPADQRPFGWLSADGQGATATDPPAPAISSPSAVHRPASPSMSRALPAERWASILLLGAALGALGLWLILRIT